MHTMVILFLCLPTVVIEERKVQSLRADNPERRDPTLLTVSSKIQRPEDLPYVDKAIDAEVRRVAQQGIDAATLQAVKSHLHYAFAKR